MKTIFTRKCPECQCEIEYVKEKMRDYGNLKNSLCRKCQNKHIREKMRPNTECKICNKPIYRCPSSLKKRKYHLCSYACRNKFFSEEKSFVWKGGLENTIKRQRVRAKERILEYKTKVVNLLGGKCSICGYNKCLAALDFHHVDPKTKTKDIKSLICGSWSKILNEIKKCVLLCANCHRELHWNENLIKRNKNRENLTKEREFLNESKITK